MDGKFLPIYDLAAQLGDLRWLGRGLGVSGGRIESGLG